MNEMVGALDEFHRWASMHGLKVAASDVRLVDLGCPHRPTSLPPGWQGIYAFRYKAVWLKVGMAGPNSGARWLSQHYNPGAAMSTLAFALVKYGHFAVSEDHRLNGLRERLRMVGPADVGDWIKQNTQRVNVLVRAELGRPPLTRLEAIAHQFLDPVFEGAWKFGNSIDGDHDGPR